MGTPGRSAQLGGASRSPCKASAAAFLLRCRQLASKNTRRCHAVLPARARKQLGAAFGSILCPCRCASPSAAPFPRPAGTGPPGATAGVTSTSSEPRGLGGKHSPRKLLLASLKLLTGSMFPTIPYKIPQNGCAERVASLLRGW